MVVNYRILSKVSIKGDDLDPSVRQVLWFLPIPRKTLTGIQQTSTLLASCTSSCPHLWLKRASLFQGGNPWHWQLPMADSPVATPIGARCHSSQLLKQLGYLPGLQWPGFLKNTLLPPLEKVRVNIFRKELTEPIWNNPMVLWISW